MARYCAAFNSCGAALAAALMAAGVERDDHVLINAFTLAPVPGAVVHAGARPVFVEITPDYHIDLADLRAKVESTGARWLLLSYMRGHVPDLDAVTERCRELGVTMRLGAVAAALVRPQLDLLDSRSRIWNQRYRELAEGLGRLDGVRVPARDDREQYVASSIQFNLEHPDIGAVVERAAALAMSSADAATIVAVIGEAIGVSRTGS